MIFKKRFHLISRQCQRHPQPIAIVVMRDIMAPVHQRRHALTRIRHPIVVGINHTVAAINFERGSDQDDYVFTDGLDKRSFFNRQAISKFHQHFR